MAPLPPCPAIKLNLSWQVEDDTMDENVLHFAFTGSADVGDLTTWATSAGSNLKAAMESLAANSVQMGVVTARDLSSDMGAEVTVGTPHAGTRGTELLAPGTAVVVSNEILRHYRGGHSRNYLPLGIASDILTSGLWDSTFTGDVEAAWAGFIAAAQDQTVGSLVVGAFSQVSYFGPPNRIITNPITGRARTISTLRATPIIDPVVSYVARTVVGSQRRRNRGA